MLRLVTDNEDGEFESWFAASIANYVQDMGEKPAGAILIMIAEDGASSLTHLNTTRYDLAMGGARLLKEATEE